MAELLDRLPTPAVLTDDSPELRCVYANAAWRRLQRGAPLVRALAGQGADRAIAALRGVVAGGEAVSLREIPEIWREPGPWSCDAVRLEGDHRSWLLAIFCASPQRPLVRRRARRPEPHALSAREWEVAGLLAQGMDNAAIAWALDIHRSTVASHVSEILARLGFSSRVQIAVWVERHRPERPPGGAS